MSVTAFPIELARRPAAPPPVACALPTDRDVSILYLAGRLGRRDADIRTLKRLIRAMIDEKAFPAPLAPRLFAGQLLTGAGAVDARSRWDRAAVDAWFDDQLPPTIAAKLAAVRDQALRDTLDQRAAGFGRR